MKLKQAQIKLTVTPRDKEWLTEVAKLAGMSLSSFMRQAIMKRAHKVFNIAVQEETEQLRAALLVWRDRALTAEKQLAAAKQGDH